VALVINSVVGAGIFGLPSQVYALAGTYSLVAWAVSALAIGLIVLCFAEVGSRFGATGGPYLYTRVAFGPLIGFEVGWLMWVARLAGFASVVNLFAAYLALFVPAYDSEVWRAGVIVVVVVVLSVANIAGVRTSTAITNVLTVGKVLPLFLLAMAGFFLVDPQRYSFAAAPSYGAFSTAALLAMFAFAGLESALIPAGEMRDPQRHVPFSLIAGMSVVAALYICVQAVCIGLVPDLAHASRPLSDAAGRIIGRAGESAVAAAALISIAGVMNAIVFASPRILFAMAENGELPRVFCSTHPRFRTPVAAIVATTTAGGLVALLSTFVSALTISTIVRLVAYMATCAALPVMRRRTGLPPTSFSAPAGPLISAGAIALGLWLLSNSPWAEVRVAAIFAVVGVALYFVGSRETRAVTATVLSSRASD
jgi:amino acid transporter